MKESLARSLIKREVLKEETEVDIRYRGKGLGSDIYVTHTFYITKLDEDEKGPVFYVRRTVDGYALKVRPSHIVAIDGMPPKRFAEVYFLTDDGDAKYGFDDEGRPKEPKRRGRKPKLSNIDNYNITFYDGDMIFVNDDGDAVDISDYPLSMVEAAE